MSLAPLIVFLSATPAIAADPVPLRIDSPGFYVAKVEAHDRTESVALVAARSRKTVPAGVRLHCFSMRDGETALAGFPVTAGTLARIISANALRGEVLREWAVAYSEPDCEGLSSEPSNRAEVSLGGS